MLQRRDFDRPGLFRRSRGVRHFENRLWKTVAFYEDALYSGEITYYEGGALKIEYVFSIGGRSYVLWLPSFVV